MLNSARFAHSTREEFPQTRAFRGTRQANHDIYNVGYGVVERQQCIPKKLGERIGHRRKDLTMDD